MRWFSCVLLLSACLLCAGIVEAKTVTLGEADNHTVVSLNLGDTLVVELPSTLPGQYRWVSHLEPNAALSAQEDSLPAVHEGAKAKENQGFRYNAARIGQTMLHLAFESEDKQGAGVPVTSRFSVRVLVASGAPAGGEAVLLGVYRGTLPCADCRTLDTELRLYAKGKFDMSNAFFVETRIYRGSPQGDVAYSDRGMWTVLKGSAADSNATVYQLNPDHAAETQAYLVKDNGATLEPLDRDLRPVASERSLALRRSQ